MKKNKPGLFSQNPILFIVLLLLPAFFVMVSWSSYIEKPGSAPVESEGSRVLRNPVFPGYHADPEIAIFNNTYYIYPTTDGSEGWTASSYKCFSSTDLINWRDEGVILDFVNISWGTMYAWAPCIIEKNGTYYFYFCANQQIGVATSNSPTGPFIDALGRPLVTTNQYNCQSIDPDVFIDDDGQAYLYFGQGRLMVVRLNPDMISFNGTPQDIEPANFNEATNVFKRNGTYYVLWSNNDTRSEDYQVNYGTMTSPMGPITYGSNNPIVQKNVSLGILGTGHNSVLQIPGRDEFYMVYHRFAIPGGDGYHREVCIDRMNFNGNGSIQPVTVTLEGVQDPVYLDPAPGNLGDVNSDDAINIVDALLVAQYYVELDPQNFNPLVADTNCDNSINIIDALLIAQYYVNLITAFPCEGATPEPTPIPVEGEFVLLNQSGWSLVYVDSQETAGENGAATNLFDGNTSTIWHTEWEAVTPIHPHEVQIDLGGTYDVGGLRYLPRQDSTINGTIADYEVYVSTSSGSWGNAVAYGTWTNNNAEKEVSFGPKAGRYIRLVALSEVNGGAWTSGAEVNVLVWSGGPTPTPGPTLPPTPTPTETPEENVYMFSYFTGDGDDGLHLAYSYDCQNWTALKNGQSFLTPTVGDRKMRDPSIQRDANGIFHMVWTDTSWTEMGENNQANKGFGYAYSTDLINWSSQRFVGVMNGTRAENTWAPELFWDDINNVWMVLWSSTVLPATRHRIYYATTTDFNTFTSTQVLYDPGYTVIDGAIIKYSQGRYAMVFKDEDTKSIAIVESSTPRGPWGSRTIIYNQVAVEGPAPAKYGNYWYVAYDEYSSGSYGLSRSTDLTNWSRLSCSFPSGVRHGTIFMVSDAFLTSLRNSL